MVKINGNGYLTMEDLHRLYSKCKRFEARSRTAIDGVSYWCVWDREAGGWCTLFGLTGLHHTHKSAVISIVHFCIKSGIIKIKE